MQVVIKGEHFYAEVRRQLDKTDPFRVNDEFIFRFRRDIQPEAEPFFLDDVVQMNTETLAGSGPETLEPGSYTAEVETPLGLTGSRPSAFTVVAGEPGIQDSETATDPYRDTSIGPGMSTDTDIETGDSAPTDTETDTQTPTDTETEPSADCLEGGVLYDDICWYLGAPHRSCRTVCGSRGGYHEDTPL